MSISPPPIEPAQPEVQSDGTQTLLILEHEAPASPRPPDHRSHCHVDIFAHFVKDWVGDPNSTPLPWPQLSVAIMVTMTEGINNGVLLPFIAFMVTDLFGYSPGEVGYYGGWIASAYFLSQIFSSTVLGNLSDRIGRKPVMLVGLIGNIITTILFGLSRSFWLAFLARFICGVFNGNTGVVKSYCREITDESNQARSWTFRIAGGAVGKVIGPVIGGALARPAVQYPTLFSQNGLFGYFPFLLPCIAASSISLVSVIFGFFFLHETVEDKTKSLDLEKDLQHATDVDSSETTSDDKTVELEDLSDRELEKPQLETNAVVAQAPSSAGDDAVVTLELDNPQERRSTTIGEHLRGGLRMIGFWFVAAYVYLAKIMEVFKDSDVSRSMMLYAIMSFNQLGTDQVFSYWALRAPEEGGIGFSTLQIGTANGIAGVGMLVMQLFFYVPIDKAISTRHTFSLAAFCLGISTFLIPFCNLLAAQRTPLWVMLGILMVMKQGWSTVGFAAVNILVNNAAPPSQLGAVNGLSASVGAAARVMSPIILGALFAATSTSNLPFPLDFHFVFVLLFLLCLVITLGSHFLLNPSINFRKKF